MSVINIKDLYIPKNKSIIVLGSYRCGTTALCDYLSNTFNLCNFDEVFHDNVPQRTDDFHKFLELNHSRYIIKIIPNQINDGNRRLIDNLMAHCFVIKCIRHNLSEQILSWYICNQTAVWHYKHDHSTKENYTVNIDKTSLFECLDSIICVNRMLDELTYKIDATLIYEDMGILSSKYKLYHRPTNYEELISTLNNVRKIQG
jgi:hypothetical protein